MLSFSDATPIYLFTPPTDMRKSFDGLCGLIETHLPARTLTAGGLFVFINRRRDRMKVMYFDGDGLAIWYKRLERGRYELPHVSEGREHVTIDAPQLRLILDGIDLKSVRRRKRYQPPEPSPARQDVTDDAQATSQARGAGSCRGGSHEDGCRI